MSKVPDSVCGGKRLRIWQVRIFWTLWTAYAGYYLCRVNFSVAQPLILREFPAWSAAQVGLIPSAYAFCYALGQITNGLLSHRFGARVMMTCAITITALVNVSFALVDSYPAMLALWALNGYAQSAGWVPLAQTVANWTEPRRRGTVIGLIASCYAVGHVASWLLSGWLCGMVGWRAAFQVPGWLMLPCALAFYLLVRNRPEDAGFAPLVEEPTGAEPGAVAGGSVLWATLANRMVWILAVGYFCMNGVRQAFMNWIVLYLTEFHGRSVSAGALVAVVVPLGGVAGGFFAGWASDVWCGGRRAPLCVVMQLGLAAVCLAFAWLPGGSWVAAAVLCGLAGFLIHGPDLLMSGVASIDVAHPRAAGFATGIIMCLGGLGGMFAGAGVGWLKDVADGEWKLLFQVLAGLVLVAALIMGTLWRNGPGGRR